jgi:hypothetical protein
MLIAIALQTTQFCAYATDHQPTVVAAQIGGSRALTPRARMRPRRPSLHFLRVDKGSAGCDSCPSPEVGPSTR